MRSKDQIIEELSRLVLDLLRVGMDKHQEVADLFCEIQKLSKEDILLPQPVDRSKITDIQDYRDQRFCYKCKTNPVMTFKTGRKSYICSSCFKPRGKAKKKEVRTD